MLLDPEGDQKWDFELWEHEEGKSRVQKELLVFKDSNRQAFDFMSKKLISYQTKALLDLKKLEYIKELRGSGGLNEIRFLHKGANLRFLGPVDENCLPRPKFFALTFFYKKSNKIPLNILKTTVERLKEFNLLRKI